MANLLKADICVVGAGPAGLAVAAAAAAHGARVIVVEKAETGGRRLNRGSIAMRAFCAAASRAEAIRTAGRFGIEAAEPEVDFKAVMRHVSEAAAAAAPNVASEHLAALGITLIEGEGRFKNRRTLIVGGVDIRARRFVLATGGAPLVPVIPGLSTVDYLTEDTVFALARRPVHLVVIGGSGRALEHAQAFRRLGAKVTLVEPAAAGGDHDPEMTAAVLRALRAEGVTIHEGANITTVERRGKTGVKVVAETPSGPEEINASHLLVAAGWAPALDALDLDIGRIALAGKTIDASKMMRTTNRRVYVTGDALGGPQSDQLAVHGALQVARALLFRMPVRQQAWLVPRVLFTDPEIAEVGLGQTEAMRRHRRVRILRLPFCENDRARAERRTRGHLKLVLDGGGRILGASIVGAGAGELIGFWAAAIARGLRLGDIAAPGAAYPTYSEIGNQAALAYLHPQVRRPLARLLVRILRLFG